MDPGFCQSAAGRGCGGCTNRLSFNTKPKGRSQAQKKTVSKQLAAGEEGGGGGRRGRLNLHEYSHIGSTSVATS